MCFKECVEEGTLNCNDFILRGACFLGPEFDDTPANKASLDFLKREVDFKGLDWRIDTVILDKKLLQRALKDMKSLGVRSPDNFFYSTINIWMKELTRELWSGKFYMINAVGMPLNTDRHVAFLACNKSGFKHLVDDSKICIYQWDEHVFSSFLSPFWKSQPTIPYNPDIHLENSYWWWGMQSQFYKQMIMVHCFPQMFECFPKRKLIDSRFRGELFNEITLRLSSGTENQKYDFKDITVIEAGRSPTQDASFYHYLADKALQLNTTHSIAKAKEYRDMAELIESKDNTIGSLVKKYLFNRHQNKQKSGIDMQQQDGDSQKDGDGDVKERNLEQELLLGDLVNKVTERIKTSTTLQGTDILIAAKNELARYGIDASYMLAGLATEEEKDKLKKGDNFVTFLRQDALTTEIIDEKNAVQQIYDVLKLEKIKSANYEILPRAFATLFSSRSRSKYDTTQ